MFAGPRVSGRDYGAALALRSDAPPSWPALEPDDRPEAPAKEQIRHQSDQLRAAGCYWDHGGQRHDAAAGGRDGARAVPPLGHITLSGVLPTRHRAVPAGDRGRRRPVGRGRPKKSDDLID